MRPFSRPGPTALSRYWAALVQGAPPAELERLAAPLDPEMLASIDKMRSLRGDPQPDPAFVTRLEKHLMNTHAGAITMPNGTRPAPSTPRAHARPRLPKRRTGGRVVPVLMTAVLILGMFGGFVAGRQLDWGRSTPGTVAPAVFAPDDELPAGVLLNVIFPADVLPPVDGRISGLSYTWVEPGSSGGWYPSCCPGPIVKHVVAGTLTVTVRRGAVQVMRADGSLDEIAADTEFEVGPGDTFISRNEISFQAENRGTSPIEMLDWTFLHNPYSTFSGHQLPGWGGPGGLDIVADDEIPELSGAIEVKLQRLSLEPDDGEFEFVTDGLRQIVVSDLETEVIRNFGAGAFIAIDSAGNLTTVYTLEIMPAFSNSILPVVGVPPA